MKQKQALVRGYSPGYKADKYAMHAATHILPTGEAEVRESKFQELRYALRCGEALKPGAMECLRAFEMDGKVRDGVCGIKCMYCCHITF